MNGRVDAGPTAVVAGGDVTLVPLTLMVVDDVALCAGTVDVVEVEVDAAVVGGTVGGEVVDVLAAEVDVAALVDVVAPFVDGGPLVVETVPTVVGVDVVEAVDVVVLDGVVAGDQVVVVLHGTVEADGVVEVDGDPLQPAQCGFAPLGAAEYPLLYWLQFESRGWGREVVAPAFETPSVANANASTAMPATVETIPTDRPAPPSCS